MQTRAIRRGELQEPWAATFVGSKQFGVWAPRVLNEMLRDQDKVREGDEEMQGEELKERKECEMPSDEFEKQRGAYYAFLEHKYSTKENCEVREEDGRIKEWTDGSARNTKRGFRAGAGIFYGHGNSQNQGCAVLGKQTNQRAELTAVLRCIEREEREVLVCTDSMYVVQGVTRGRFKRKRRAWYKNPGKARFIDNADLWQKVDTVMREKGGKVMVKWVKGHALLHHIVAGRTTEQDIWGNNESDRLAGEAAESK